MSTPKSPRKDAAPKASAPTTPAAQDRENEDAPKLAPGANREKDAPKDAASDGGDGEQSEEKELRPTSRLSRANGGPDWAPAYLASLAKTARKAWSAEKAGITVRAVQLRRHADAAFAAAEEDAMKVARDMIEDEIMRRAVEGWEEPVFGSGGKGVGTVQVGVIRKFDSTLLLRAAEWTETGSWRQRQQIEHGTPGQFATRAERKAALAKAREEAQASTQRGAEAPRPLSLPSKN